MASVFATDVASTLAWGWFFWKQWRALSLVSMPSTTL